MDGPHKDGNAELERDNPGPLIPDPPVRARDDILEVDPLDQPRTPEDGAPPPGPKLRTRVAVVESAQPAKSWSWTELAAETTKSAAQSKVFLVDSVEPVRSTAAGWLDESIKSPVSMVGFAVVGLVMSIAHIVCYARLNGKLVGDEYSQAANLRYGTAFAFLSQITLPAAVWLAYTQQIWVSLKHMKEGMTVDGIDAVFSADTTIVSLLNLEMLDKFRIGAVMAFFAWGLELPPFFTPATLFVYPSVNVAQEAQQIPQLQIANASMYNYFAYSPPKVRGVAKNGTNKWPIFTGPRTIMSLLSSATASLGQIMRIAAPYHTSSYSLQFYAPITRCDAANDTAAGLMDSLLEQKMNSTVISGSVETDSAYWAFVPVFDENGDMQPVDAPRLQVPSNATNELWVRLSRYVIDGSGAKVRVPVHQVCQLYNASYAVTIAWDNGVQSVTGGYDILEPVGFPPDMPDADLSVHAYAAHFWALTDLTVGSFGWFQELTNETELETAAQFGFINSPIQHNSLLGSSDLDVFFDFEYTNSLYAGLAPTLNDQRLQDIELARNRTMDVLIEELSFNITMSLFHDALLTSNITGPVTRVDDVNRYGYQPLGLVLPYALSNAFTWLVVAVGLLSYWRHGVLGDKRFSDIARAARDPEIAATLLVRDHRRNSLHVVVEGGRPKLQVKGLFGEGDGKGAEPDGGADVGVEAGEKGAEVPK